MTTLPPLIVCEENDPELLRLFISAMGKSNPRFQIKFVPNGIKMVGFLKELKHKHDLVAHLILLDHELPRKDGLAVVSELKTISDYSDTPMYVLIDKLNSDTIHSFKQLGVTDCIQKPRDFDSITKWIKAFDNLLNPDI